MLRAFPSIVIGSLLFALAACVGGPGQLPDQGVDQTSQGSGVSGGSNGTTDDGASSSGASSSGTSTGGSSGKTGSSGVSTNPTPTVVVPPKSVFDGG